MNRFSQMEKVEDEDHYILESYDASKISLVSIRQLDGKEQEIENSDAYINAFNKLDPGRLKLQAQLFLSLLDPKNFKTIIVPISLQMCMFNKKCYVKGDPSYQLLNLGQMQLFYND